jgi:tRNA/tmRNA/rRNA uracil-C5-methylase (TrmA/RlmC/RlmD family)
MKKKELKTAEGLEITAISSDGRGIARQEGKVIFTEFAVPGDVVNVTLHRAKKSYAEGKITALTTPPRLCAKPRLVFISRCVAAANGKTCSMPSSLSLNNR